MNLSKIAVIGTSTLLVLIVPLFTKCSGEYGVTNRVGGVVPSSVEENLTHSLKVINGTLPESLKFSDKALAEISLLKNNNHKLEVENEKLIKKVDSLNVKYKKSIEDLNKKIVALNLENQKRLEEAKSMINQLNTQGDQIVSEISVINKKNQELLVINMTLNEQINSLKESSFDKSSLQKVKATSSLLELAESKKTVEEKTMKLSEVEHQFALYKMKTEGSDETYAIEQIEIIDVPQKLQ